MRKTDYSKSLEGWQSAIATLSGEDVMPSGTVNIGTVKGVLSDAHGNPLIQDPVSKLPDLLVQAKAAPRFRNDTYDAVDRIDAAMFSGDEFLGSKEVRQHFRYYLARWEKQLREYDEFDRAMDGEEG